MATQAPQKAWCCGFSIQSFPSLEERLNNIDTQHLGRGQSTSDWASTKVAQGLPLQPIIREPWQHLLDLLDPFRRPKISWIKSGREDLQHRLEERLRKTSRPRYPTRAGSGSF